MDITANFKLTSPIKERVKTKLLKLDKYNLERKKVTVTLRSHLHCNKVKILLSSEGEHFEVSETDSEDMYFAIDKAVNTMEKRVRRHLASKKAIDRKSVRYEKVPFIKQDEGETEARIVKRKPISVKPMSEEEAILQMELLNHRSFLFHNVDTDSPCMIYKRHDGNYGIIETV